jgi:hypothetical protein
LSPEQAGQLALALATILEEAGLTWAFFLPLFEGLEDRLLAKEEAVDHLYHKV